MASGVTRPFYHKLAVGCWQGQVDNRFYGVLAADMAGRETSPCYSEQGQVAHRFNGLLAADMAVRVASPSYAELAAGRAR